MNLDYLTHVIEVSLLDDNSTNEVRFTHDGVRVTVSVYPYEYTRMRLGYITRIRVIADVPGENQYIEWIETANTLVRSIRRSVNKIKKKYVISRLKEL